MPKRLTDAERADIADEAPWWVGYYGVEDRYAAEALGMDVDTGPIPDQPKRQWDERERALLAGAPWWVEGYDLEEPWLADEMDLEKAPKCEVCGATVPPCDCPTCLCPVTCERCGANLCVDCLEFCEQCGPLCPDCFFKERPAKPLGLFPPSRESH